MNKKLIFTVLLICVLAFVAVLAFGQSSPNVRWEYTQISPSLDRANELGQQGWEFILIRASGDWMFKRRLP